MITVRFFKKGSVFTGFEVEGHAFFDDEGRDIVCAAVSSAVYMTANTVTEVLCEKCECIEKEGYIKLSLCEDASQSALDVLRGLELHLRCLAEDYPENLKVIYHGGVKNA